MLTDIKKGNKRIHPFVPNHISCLKNKRNNGNQCPPIFNFLIANIYKIFEKNKFFKRKKGSSPKKI